VTGPARRGRLASLRVTGGHIARCTVVSDECRQLRVEALRLLERGVRHGVVCGEAEGGAVRDVPAQGVKVVQEGRASLLIQGERLEPAQALMGRQGALGQGAALRVGPLRQRVPDRQAQGSDRTVSL
jgi:hypothetical protein